MTATASLPTFFMASECTLPLLWDFMTKVLAEVFQSLSQKKLCLCLKILLFPFLLFALPIFKGLIEITPSFHHRFFKMTSQTKSNVYDREWRWHLSMSCASVSTFKCLTATACLPMPPPSSFKQSFPQRKAKVAAIVIVIVVKTYKIQGRKPGGLSK